MKFREWGKIVVFALIAAVASVPASVARAEPLSTLQLKAGSRISGFVVDRLYDDDRGLMAVRLIHQGTCAPLIYMQKGVVPQFFTAVDTPSENDRGLPHSLEHILMGKGTRGRIWNLMRQMRLAHTSAATDFDHTYYGFDAPIGMASFYEELHAFFEALFQSDFTDEEAQAEFYHFSVERNSTTGQLSLSEKGAVYSEMQSQFGANDAWYTTNRLILGADHPWSFVSGGRPQDMRSVTPAMIRAFEAAHYRLGPGTNFYATFGAQEGVKATLDRIGEQIDKFATKVPPSGCRGEYRLQRLDLYPPHPQGGAQVKLVPFPAKTVSDPTGIQLAWNPVRARTYEDRALLGLFFELLAKDSDSPFYLDFISSQKRVFDSGATRVGASLMFLSHSPNWRVPKVQLDGIPGDRVSVAFALKFRTLVVKRIDAIAVLPNGAPKLELMKRKALAILKAQKSDQFIWLRTPPRLGIYQGFADWKASFDELDVYPESEVSFDSTSRWQQIEAKIRTQPNPWAAIIRHFKLTSLPHAIVSLPSPKMLHDDEIERAVRIDAETTRLRQKFGASDDQSGLATALKAEQATLKRFEKIGQSVPKMTFAENPPLIPDPDAVYERGHLAGGAPYHASLFDETPGHSVRLRFDLRGLPPELHPYVSILSSLFIRAGLREGSQVTTSADLQTQMEEAEASIAEWPEADRQRRTYAWVAQADGRTLENVQGSLGFLRRALLSPDLETSNLARVREILKSRVSVYAGMTTGGNIDWMAGAATAFRAQADPLYLAIASPFTRAHWLDRVMWRLHEVPLKADLTLLNQAVEQVLNSGSQAPLAWEAAIHQLSDQGLVGDLKEFWLRNLKLLARGNEARGLRELWNDTRTDLTVGPGSVLKDLRWLRDFFVRQGALTVEVTTTPTEWKTLKPELESYLAELPPRAGSKSPEQNFHAKTLSNRQPVVEHLRARDRSFRPQFPYYLGFVNEDGTSGDAIITADGPTLDDVSRAHELLAARVFGGSGPHSFFMRTWEAGLAHTNGISASEVDGLLQYYADESTDISALMRLILSEAHKSAKLDPVGMGDYALSSSFSAARMVEDPITRGASTAWDFRVGVLPDRARRFGLALLKDRHNADFDKSLVAQAYEAIAPVLLSGDHLDRKRRAHSIFFFVGPESQLHGLDPEIPRPSKLTRIYPSDYWLAWPKAGI